MKYTFMAALLCLLVHGKLLAQTGEIYGTVIDKETSQPLAGTNILVEKTGDGVAANAFGKFTIKDLPAGKYELKISFVGFEKLNQIVEVKAGEKTSIDVQLAPDALSLGDVEITQSLAQNASTISALDIQLRPITTSQDVLRIVPGLFIAQHAGGGKAEQIFLRGFDIDHGTDIALTVDGMPVNMVSHAHGQGYSDLHFVIPETIERVAFDKGPYYASKGNLNTAGFADFQTKKTLGSNMFKLEGGQFGTMRTVGMFNLLKSEKVNDPSLYLATEYFRTEGFFDSPQHFNRFNALLKFHQRISDDQTLEISASNFTSSWNASGQIPERAVESGQISRFGSIDNTEGGETGRSNLNMNLTSDLPDGGVVQNQVYYSKYDFKLISNFTFFLNDPVNGDQITQSENRKIYGTNNRYWNNWNLFGLNANTEFGAGFRFDKVDDIRLSRTYQRETVLSDMARGNIQETNMFVYGEEEVNFTSKISLTGGLRYDYFTFDYENLLSAQYDRKVENKGILTPKFKLSYQAANRLNFYVKSGIGYHSNDTRVVVAQNGKQILPKAYGVDLGTLWKPTEQFLVNLAFWRLDLDQEFVYVGDEGIVEAGGKTQREGVDLTMRYQLTPWLYANVDLNYTHPRSIEEAEGQNYIPLAPTFTSVGGLSFDNNKGFRGSLRYRYLDDRPANEDNSVVAEGYFIMDALVNYAVGAFDFGISVQNVLDTDWKEAQFDTESRLKNEAQPVSEIHFTPGTPFQAKVSVAVKF